MILELCGGEPGTVTAAGAEPAWQRDATMRFARIASFGGSDIPADEAVASLERLGFTVRTRDADQRHRRRAVLAQRRRRADHAGPVTHARSRRRPPRRPKAVRRSRRRTT